MEVDFRAILAMLVFASKAYWIDERGDKLV